jgi:type II secretion system protein D
MTPAHSSARTRLARAVLVAAHLCAVPGLPVSAQAPPPTPPPTPPAGVPGAALTNAPPAGGAGTNAVPDNGDIQLSFQGANIDMVVQWLATTTGKSVLKHPQVNCQLTIIGGKKLAPRQAISLVYRALAMEGFSAVESGNSILIVPEGREPKVEAEFLDPSRKDIPVGRQRMVKIFSLTTASAAEVRDKLKPMLSDKAALEINERANQLIITDYTDGLSLAGDLIHALDTDQAGDRTLRIIPLAHVGAQELVKEIGPLYQKMGGKGNDTVEVSANDRSNSLIVLSSEANYRALEKVIRTLDTDDAQEKVVHAFILKNADAEDVAKQIKELLVNQDSSSRYPYFIFGGDAPAGNKKKVSVVADRRRNTVVIQGPPGELPSITKLIESLDEPAEGESLAPKIYALKYTSATDVEDVLNELFLKKNQQQRPYWYYDDEPPQTADRNVGRLYGKVRITSEPYSNTIIITSNSKESLTAVEDVLKRLDVPSQAGESTFRVTLKYAKASTLANSLNILFAKGGSPPLRQNPQVPQNQNQQNQQPNANGITTDKSFELQQDNEEEGYFPWLGGSPDTARGSDGRNVTRQVSDLVGRVRAVADHRSNSLMVSSSVHLLPQIMKLVDELDAPTPQVLIEARIVEVSANFLDKLGVRWTPDGSKVLSPADYDNSFLVGTSTKYSKGFGGKTEVNSGGSGGIAAALASLRSGVIDSTISMDFLVQFLRQNVSANVLAEPQINVGDNETAKLFVGSQVPFIKESQNTQVGSLNQTFSYKDVGVILEVVPHLNKDGDVNLKIRTESSTIQPGQTLFGGAILDTRNFKTHVTAKSGQTLVIGGIIQKQVSETVRKVPGLGNIPGMGWAFKKKDKTIQEVELLVFLRPTVVRNPEESKALTDDVTRRMPLIDKWEVEAKGATNGLAKPKAEGGKGGR